MYFPLLASAISCWNFFIYSFGSTCDFFAESTKPYSQEVSADIQLSRLLPILEYTNKNNVTIPISIDTRSHIVADEVLKIGDYTINDVSGMEHDKKMAEIIAKHDSTIIIQHAKGTPENMQNSPEYNNVVEEVFMHLKARIEYAQNCGINKIIIDPGIGFGKTKEHNLEILSQIESFKTLNFPIMVGLSRKSFLCSENDNNDAKDSMSLAFNSRLIEKEIDYIRVHNVKLHKNFIKIF